MATAEDVKYLGIALKSPVQISSTGTAVLSYGQTAVEESIKRILDTPIGITFMNPDYGSRLHELFFEQADDFLISMMRLFIQDAISRWEKRVKFVDAHFNIQGNKIETILEYQVLSSNQIDSFIYPFYLRLKN